MGAKAGNQSLLHMTMMTVCGRDDTIVSSKRPIKAEVNSRGCYHGNGFMVIRTLPPQS